VSLGGFTSVIQMRKCVVSGGFHETGVRYSDASAELEGQLVLFERGGVRRVFEPDAANVSVQITFSDEEISTWEVPDDQPYIGTISFSEIKSEDRPAQEQTLCRAHVDIVLPVNMFSLIRGCQATTSPLKPSTS
jgi:hypothetical protein